MNMLDVITIQETNVVQLRELDPKRISVEIGEAPAQRSCDTDSQHGKGVCYLLAQGEQEVDVLCLACALLTAEVWLTADIEHLMIVVAR
jgi:hypothetical protein